MSFCHPSFADAWSSRLISGRTDRLIRSLVSLGTWYDHPLRAPRVDKGTAQPIFFCSSSKDDVGSLCASVCLYLSATMIVRTHLCLCKRERVKERERVREPTSSLLLRLESPCGGGGGGERKRERERERISLIGLRQATVKS